jgi:hypothetical protein
MKIIIIIIFAFCAFAINSNAQTTYDVFTYTEPAGYKKEVAKDHITYTKTDSKKGTYCVINLYKQSPSSGDIVKDFENDWTELVATPLGVTATPQKDNGDEITGWKTYSGAASFEFNGGTAMAILTTAKKDNNNAAIIIIANAKDMIVKDVDPFFATLKLGKPKTSLANNTGQQAKANNDVQAKTNNNASNNTNSKSNSTYSTEGNGIAGVWVAYARDIVLKKLQFKTKVFFNNGKYLSDMPAEGLDNINESTEFLGTFKTDKATINYKAGNWTGSSSFEQSSPTKITLEVSDHYYKSTNPNGKMLQGTYILYNVDEASWQNLPKGDRQVIHFNNNGTFEDEGVYKFMFSDSPSNFDLPGKGTYAIKNYTIYLKYSDGRGERKPQSIYNYAANYPKFEDAKIIFIGGIQLSKVK